MGGERDLVYETNNTGTGSSPRGRGTLAAGAAAVRLQRFIPARAGNAATTKAPNNAPAVHPRAGGERNATATGYNPNSGSSPRGRGTRPPVLIGAIQIRFIPARAGNARCRLHLCLSNTVHPRAGGERVTPTGWLPPPCGSSPRGRGTLRHQRPGQRQRRFIPARAGNARSGLMRCWGWTVHPRAGGERFLSPPKCRGAFGSSPRGRGTRRRDDQVAGESRFIPARAGNADAEANMVGDYPVHPRVLAAANPRINGAGRKVGTELAVESMVATSAGWQAPVNAASRRRRWPKASIDRGMPASQNRPQRSVAADQRRAVCRLRCGITTDWAPFMRRISRRQPPRGRGTRMCRRWGIRRGRFIPARAGNAAEVVSPAPVRPVHPRAGGERRRAMSARSRRCGSSPRGRGTLGGCNSYGEIFRFIPARAGNATIYKACGAKVSVHPRAGGERAASSWCRTCRSGSSPRGRGTPRSTRSHSY